MKRPITTSLPPPSAEPTGIHALDAFYWGRWPHLFNLLAREYKVPGDFMLVLLYLWDATVMAKSGPERGFLANSQIPVRERQRTKWLAAFESSAFFSVKKAGPHDHKGSRYSYDEEVRPEAWEAFFALTEWLNKFEKWDKVSVKKFAAWFTPENLLKVEAGGLDNEITWLKGQAPKGEK